MNAGESESDRANWAGLIASGRGAGLGISLIGFFKLRLELRLRSRPALCLKLGLSCNLVKDVSLRSVGDRAGLRGCFSGLGKGLGGFGSSGVSSAAPSNKWALLMKRRRTGFTAGVSCFLGGS
jgi:hypothetical protein